MTVGRPSGLVDPLGGTPPRPACSVRRTSHIDIAPGDGDGPFGDGLSLRGAARDLRTTGGRVEVLAGAELDAFLDGERQLRSLVTVPADPRTAELAGRAVAGGFRAALDAALPGARAAATPLYLLLDELPVAALISGYAQLYSGTLGPGAAAGGQLKADICAGWRSDGTMLVALGRTGAIPVPLGPAPPPLETPEDPLAWHPIGPLPAGAMRRRRLVEVGAGDPLTVFALFRDTHVDDNGVETILHEYTLTAALDPVSLVLSDCRARPRVLPWVECPAAADSAARLDGHAVGDVRRLVARELRGTTTCTHLNDLLRSLGDLGTLAAALAGP